MKVFTQWFFIIGSFAFLFWYMPAALRDNKVTLIEIGTIALNVLCFLINFSNYISKKMENPHK